MTFYSHGGRSIAENKKLGMRACIDTHTSTDTHKPCSFTVPPNITPWIKALNMTLRM